MSNVTKKKVTDRTSHHFNLLIVFIFLAFLFSITICYIFLRFGILAGIFTLMAVLLAIAMTYIMYKQIIEIP